MARPLVQKLICGWGVNNADYATCQQIDGKSKICPFYDRWRGMIKRSIDPTGRWKGTAYESVSVGEGFKMFMDFKCWPEDQGFNLNNFNLLHLDKDILSGDVKLYSPETCAFVTRKVNNLLLTSEGKRGECLLGVSKCVKASLGRRYYARYTDNRRGIRIGAYASEAEAHRAWQLAKADYIERSIKGYEEESFLIGIKYREDIVKTLLNTADKLRNDAEYGIITYKL